MLQRAIPRRTEHSKWKNLTVLQKSRVCQTAFKCHFRLCLFCFKGKTYPVHGEALTFHLILLLTATLGRTNSSRGILFFLHYCDTRQGHIICKHQSEQLSRVFRVICKCIFQGYLVKQSKLHRFPVYVKAIKDAIYLATRICCTLHYLVKPNFRKNSNIQLKCIYQSSITFQIICTIIQLFPRFVQPCQTLQQCW